MFYNYNSHFANKTRFHFKHAWGLHSSKSNLRGEAEHAVPQAPSQAHEAGDILPGSCIAPARESWGGGKREGGSILINLPKSAQALTLLTADIWRKKITLQVPPRLFQQRADGEEAEHETQGTGPSYRKQNPSSSSTKAKMEIPQLLTNKSQTPAGIP